MVIDDFKKYHAKKTGDKFYVILRGGNIVKYWCDIEPAIDAKEVTISKDSVSTEASATKGFSVADELIKLNQLRKDSLITESEYQVQKRKLLDK